MSTESPILNPPASAGPASAAPQPPRSRGEIWQHRIKAAILVVFFIEVGMMLVVLPWTTFWDDNKLLLMRPALHAFVTNGFVRGALSGLGLINVWIGIWEAVHYTETI